MKEGKEPYHYQGDFSRIVPSMYNEQPRIYKARKTTAVILDYLGTRHRYPKDLDLLDIGCSSGYMTSHYGRHFKTVVGVDIDKEALEHAIRNNQADNVTFRFGDAMVIDSPSGSFDAVTCSHIYEHVPDTRRMMREIHRVLKDDGFCYFVAGNRLNFMEPHYRLPLLSIVPKSIAHRYIRLVGKADSYYETHLTLWGLRRLVRDFEVVDYTVRVIHDPERFSATDMIVPGSMKHKLSRIMIAAAYWLCPTYIWILQKKY